MRAITEKFDTLYQVASEIGIHDKTIRKWKSRGRVPGDVHVKLIVASGGSLDIADFMEDAQ